MKMSEIEKISELIEGIECRLADELSKDLFHARLKNMINRNVDELRNDILDIAEKYNWEWEVYQMDRMCASFSDIPGIVIFGCGINGKQVCRLFKGSKYRNLPILFCDNNREKWGKEVLGYKVISPEELRTGYRDYICVIGSSKYRQGILEQLLQEGFPNPNILYPYIGILFGTSGWQYFDYFIPGDNEIFIDGGVYGGESSGDFVKWTGGNYQAIYGFEANPYCIERCKKYYIDNDIHDVEFIEKCMWNERAKMIFASDHSGASKISNEGNTVVDTDTIDNVLDGRSVTFIKMDIEGAEYRALLGAEKTIKKYHPRMALSVYHKPQDIIEIPTLLLEYNDSYRFALRQYSSLADETVLYVF
jgi:FkbM family methyltransferase